MKHTMSPLERAAWVYMAETGQLREFLWEGPERASVGRADVAYLTRLHQEAVRIGKELRKIAPVSPVEGPETAERVGGVHG